jgi:hypothetical protein
VRRTELSEPTTNPEATRPLTAVEAITTKLQRDIAAGQESDFSEPPWNRPTLDAEWIRTLVLRTHASNGVSIRGLKIDGLLNLRDGRAESGGPCNALMLTDCTLAGDRGSPDGPGIDASHAHLERLSLKDCRLGGVELSRADIAGDLDLDGMGPRDRGACWVKARGVRVGGSVTARRAKLSIPWPSGHPWPPDDVYWQELAGPNALDLSGAQIDGELVLSPRFESAGGVNVSGATIGQSMNAAGARLVAAGVGQSTEALFGQYLRVAGPVWLCRDTSTDDGQEPFRASGTLNFYGAELGGTVVFSDAVVKVTGAAHETAALHLPLASVEGDVHLDPLDIPSVNLITATIQGDLLIAAPPGAPIQSIASTTLRIRGDLRVRGPLSETDFSGSVIDGRLELGTRNAPLLVASVNGSEANVLFADARVGRDLKVSAVRTGAQVRIDWEKEPLRRRTHQLSCYRGWPLTEVLFESLNGSGLAMLAYMKDSKSHGFVLDGTGMAIYRLGEFLDIGTEEKAAAYLTFFCTHVWGDEGPFAVDQDTIVMTPSSGVWLARAQLQYGAVRFGAQFRIDISEDVPGFVEMLDGDPIDRVREDVGRRLYAPPFRWFEGMVPLDGVADWPVPPPFTPEAWSDVEASDADDEAILSTLREAHAHGLPAATEWPIGWRSPAVDLGGLKVASLDDGDGDNWFERRPRPRPGAFERLLARLLRMDAAEDEAEPQALRLRLDGFEYDRIKREAEIPTRKSDFEEFFASARAPLHRRVGNRIGAASTRLRSLGRMMGHPRSTLVRWLGDRDTTLDARTAWLESQYEQYPPTADEYQPQPYEQLARVLRASGNLGQANSVMYDKIKLQTRLRPGSVRGPTRLWHKTKQLLYRSTVGFAIGTAVVKPFRMFGLFVVVWLVGVTTLYAFPRALKVDASAVSTVLTTQAGVERIVVPTDHVAQSRDEITCGNQVSRWAYPIDVMIPFIDLRQESRCEFSVNEPQWTIAKNVYALAGWLLTGGLVLALSGVVRRQFER